MSIRCGKKVTNRVRWVGTGLIAGLALAIAACATSGGEAGAFIPYPPPGYAHRIGTSAVELFWNCARPEANILVLEGLVFNPRSAQNVRDLEFSLVGVDSLGVTLSEASGAAQSLLVGTMQATKFELTLRLAGSETRFDLFYRYHYNEPGDEFAVLHGGHPPVLLVASPTLMVQSANNYYMVRDACSDTQHRAR
ncbi:MAG TPA: hypothetical protein VN203_02085 [Candidatus Acidoferrum sp.]|nr:hypothetical protein [Candidatus Acidoferrum sp.]